MLTAGDELGKNDDAFDAANTLIDFFKTIDMRLNDTDEFDGKARKWNSTFKGAQSVDTNSRHLGFGSVQKLGAVIHYSATEAEGREDVSDALFRAAGTMDSLTKSAAREARDNSEAFQRLWALNQSIESSRVFKESMATSFCEFRRATGHRVNGVWNLRVSFSDLLPLIQADVSQRNVYTQFVYPDDSSKTLRTRSVEMSQCDANGTFSRQPKSKGYIATWKPVISWSDFITTTADENPAMQRVRSSGGIKTDTFNDVDTMSEIAIFLLPVVIALLPTALLQDVSSGMSLAILLSIDIVSAIPIFVKSLELLQLTTSRYYFTETVFFGGPDVSADAAAAEVYIVKCGLNEYFRRIGLGLLPLLFVLTSVAILLDFLTYKWLKKLKTEYLKLQGLHHIMEAPRTGIIWYRKVIKLMKESEYKLNFTLNGD